eukprot:CAMPEP_0172173634 /NCGR_PEP_ID=MMETSP1050-20130122/13176_1 /TAXON_ID=233186 /ORGANISM="Cryptomonas curvata, Strain CCAP979/52" /LENGTH=67 /DNA_ID=CAMNT_0012845437 /DNA_START=72 /DNA_END=275 /DNA_ORIENTATION=+
MSVVARCCPSAELLSINQMVETQKSTDGVRISPMTAKDTLLMARGFMMAKVLATISPPMCGIRRMVM